MQVRVRRKGITKRIDRDAYVLLRSLPHISSKAELTLGRQLPGIRETLYVTNIKRTLSRPGNLLSNFLKRLHCIERSARAFS